MTATNGSPTEPKKASPILRAVQRAISGVLIAGLILGAYLYFYSNHQLGYLTGRNQRALASTSTMIGAKVQSADQLLKSVGKIVQSSAADSAAGFIPAFGHLALGFADSTTMIRTAANAAACARNHVVVGDSGKRSRSRVDPPIGQERWQRVPNAPSYCLYRSFEITIVDTLTGRRATHNGIAYINIATYLKPDLQARVFEKVAIADSTGLVLVESGAPDLILARLDVGAKGADSDSTASWNSLSAGSGIGRLNAAGKTFRLFLDPCCRLNDGSHWSQPFLVAGLVANGQMVRDSLRISLTLVEVLSFILILMVLSWPFLKFRLIGERQPVSLVDGMFLGFSCFLTAGLAAIFCFNLYAYLLDRNARDGELGALSTRISTNFRREITAARQELTRLLRSYQEMSDTAVSQPARNSIFKSASPGYPFFESWSMINDTGLQVRKWSTDAYVQQLVPVKDRAYFREIKDGRGWMPDDTGDRFHLESTVSRTTGKRQAALSIPVVDSNKRPPDSLPTPVASMAMEVVSLIGVILPSGYGFAVVDEAGQVLFHSDPTRNLDESFLSETDDNRRLASAIAARTVDTLNVRYGGFDHRAHVAPLADLPWSLVTFLEKEPGRITRAEALLSSTYIVLCYTILLSLFGALVLMFVPGYRVPWLWPDRRLYETYERLVVVNALFLAAFLVAFAFLQLDDLLATAFLLPTAAIAATWSGLTERRALTGPDWLLDAAVLASSTLLGWTLLQSAAAGWAHLCVYVFTAGGAFLALLQTKERGEKGVAITNVYITLAVLFILVIGALPATAFFKVANDAHTEMQVKGNQLHLARRLEQRADSIRLAYTDELGKGKTAARSMRLCTPPKPHELCELDLYYRFYLNSELRTVTGEKDKEVSSDLVGLFLAPYRPQTSVNWRGTFRSAAEDSAWSWVKLGRDLQFRGSVIVGRPEIALTSIVPGLRPVSAEQELAALLLLALLMLLVWRIAEFVTRRFFLIDVTDPVVVSRERCIESIGGTNLFVVCRDAMEEEAIVVPEEGKPIDLPTRLKPDGDLRWLTREVEEGDLVLLKHFEYQLDLEETTRHKVDLLDALVHEYNCRVVVVSGQHEDGSPLGLRAAWRMIRGTGQQQSGAAKALESLVVVDAGRWPGCGKEDDRRRATRKHASAVDRIIAQESRCDRHLESIWRELGITLKRPSRRLAKQGREELLDVMGERAEVYYNAIWESCRLDERSVLVHLAASGLVNEKDRRILRRLLARGVIRREPNFVIMNETFRRYLLARAPEVEAELPPQPSSWDAVRQPVLAIGVALGILLLVTQQELFSATTAVVTALGTGLATFSRITGLFDRKSGARTG